MIAFNSLCVSCIFSTLNKPANKPRIICCFRAVRNGGHKMGYQYSDESEEESEHRSHDGSLHDTASDRTHSRGLFFLFLF